MTLNKVYAHTPGPDGTWHELSQHLQCTANLARTFAAAFGGGDLAYWLGLWHDLGKCNPAFQAYLAAQETRQPYPIQPHAIWGAALAYHLIYKLGKDQTRWKEVALPIAGHHTGLDDGETLAQDIEHFLSSNPCALTLLATQVRELPAVSRLQLPDRGATRRELFIRMVFSALLDADRLDTEKHFNPERTAARSRWLGLPDLRRRLHKAITAKIAGGEAIPVNQVRREVYESCLTAATGPPGVYRLTVPTGGGKTLSGLAFALDHAVANRLRRVVVAIPYTSIIDQTADVYRQAFKSEDAFLEHHSQVEAPEDESEDPHAFPRRLATENWDAPLIVTTTVQLFESLLGNRTSRVRKLHNLARSVIILDEVQTLPPELLEPTLDALRALVEEYGVTVVLSTATQPALEDTPYIKAFQGLIIHQIVPDYPRHFQALRRVRFHVDSAPLSWDEVAKEVRRQKQIMVILNRRRDALELLRHLNGMDDIFHLSTLLCGAHRRAILADVRAGLDRHDPRPVRLISTQVVEAGVDIDFPTVWRAMGPLDRIVQAAGRCNREGKLVDKGQVVIFEPAEGGAPGGPYKAGIEEARALLRGRDPEELHAPELYWQYFQKLFAVVPPDGRGIQLRRAALKYPAVAQRYRLIIDDTVPVVVRYGDGLQRLDEWLRRPMRVTWQRLQPYLVNVYARDVPRLRDEGLAQVTEGLFRWDGHYDDRIGIAEARLDPSDLIG